MAIYHAKMLNATRGGEAGEYPFEGPDDLFNKTSDQVVRAFFLHVDRDIFHHHVDYEINASFKSKEGDAVTAMGSLILNDQSHLPFILLISIHEPADP
ncbi:MAG: hypothetical protein AAF724_03765 [Pseudomonadota bacterium]